ncbi:hypothetical protein [Rhodoplanes serenus]|uniref:hypothetical protein n=1 Tax=Rhodoplanes serenus TaxID=200615 RepID=UPI000DAB3ED3|nr:hypothetical protein [Rhodoplanes serenus]RAI28289.1 hypothetical protein CH340_23685 [Rhodoplanes serenus]
MPITNPSPALREALRRDGLCRETGAVARWGFHPADGASLFILAAEEALPAGWFDTPAKFPATSGAPDTVAPPPKKRKG